MLEKKHPIYKARVSVSSGLMYNVNSTGYVEVTVDCSPFTTTCPCKYKDEYGLNCPHVKALLLRLGELGIGSTYIDSYSADVPGMCTTGKLKADENYCPPDFKRTAGRPSKKRKDRSYMATSNVKRECKACGELGHFAMSCQNPSTEYRYYKHKGKALAWCNERELIEIEE